MAATLPASMAENARRLNMISSRNFLLQRSNTWIGRSATAKWRRLSLLDLHQHIERQRALGVNAQRIDFDFRYPRIAADQRAKPQHAIGDRLEIGGRRAAAAAQQRRAFEFLQFLDDAVAVDSGGKNPDIVQRLDPDAAEADGEDRSPPWLAPRADHQFEPRRRHRFDQHAVEDKVRLRLADSGRDTVPGPQQRCTVGDGEG